MELREVYGGADGSLTGAARLAQEQKDQAATAEAQREIARRQRALEKRRQALEAQVLALRAKLDAEADELQGFIEDTSNTQRAQLDSRLRVARSRSNHGAVPEAGTAGGREEDRS